MISRNWMKWIAGSAVAALTVIALPAVGQGHVHYTGTTPASVTPVKLTAVHPVRTSTRHTGKLVVHKKHRKHKKLHSKTTGHTKLHHTLSRHTLSTSHKAV